MRRPSPAVHITELVSRVAPQLLTEPGFGPLTAAKLVAEIAGADRFATDAKLGRSAGLAPIPVSSRACRVEQHVGVAVAPPGRGFRTVIVAGVASSSSSSASVMYPGSSLVAG